jgi:hypothetical protein
VNALEASDSLYAILEVGPSASFEEIQHAYERIMSYLAVDSMAMYSLGVDPAEIAEQRARVEEAFRVLGDPQLRAAYDSSRQRNDADRPAMASTSRDDDGPGRPLAHVDEEFAQRFEESYPEDYQDEYDDDLPPGMVPPIPAPLPEQAAAASAPLPEQGGSVTELAVGFSNLGDGPTKPVPGVPAIARVDTPPPMDLPPPKILPVGAPERLGPGRRRLKPRGDLPVFSDDTEIGGGVLKRLRESCDASLEEVAAITKINKRYLRAIEENEYEVLPALVYVRGFVHEYARVLGLDPKTVARGYLKLYSRYKEGKTGD